MTAGEERYPVSEQGGGVRSPGVAEALGVRIGLVAAGRSVMFTLAGKGEPAKGLNGIGGVRLVS